jgi:hypothetical protein
MEQTKSKFSILPTMFCCLHATFIYTPLILETSRIGLQNTTSKEFRVEEDGQNQDHLYTHFSGTKLNLTPLPPVGYEKLQVLYYP